MSREKKMPRLPKEWREMLREAGRKGGKIGGRVRAARLTPERRSDIARQAVAAREAKRKAKTRKGGR
jgi:hypothetical protein